MQSGEKSSARFVCHPDGRVEDLRPHPQAPTGRGGHAASREPIAAVALCIFFVVGSVIWNGRQRDEVQQTIVEQGNAHQQQLKESRRRADQTKADIESLQRYQAAIQYRNELPRLQEELGKAKRERVEALLRSDPRFQHLAVGNRDYGFVFLGPVARQDLPALRSFAHQHGVRFDLLDDVTVTDE